MKLFNDSMNNRLLDDKFDEHRIRIDPIFSVIPYDLISNDIINGMTHDRCCFPYLTTNEYFT